VEGLCNNYNYGILCAGKFWRIFYMQIRADFTKEEIEKELNPFDPE
jgi:hypothetical protein